MLHYIYCYTNKINNKKYIGQTNDIKRRQKQHLQDSFHQHKGHENAYKQLIHQAIRKYGIENFDFEILDTIDTENWDDVNKLEFQYINKYNTLSPNGYNLMLEGNANPGQNKSKIPEETIQAIIVDLKNKVPIKDIAEKYHLSRPYISDINNGRCLKQPNETYPLQQNRITKEEYLQIINLLKNTNYTMSKIAEYMHRNQDTIHKINKGHQKIVRDLYDGPFPIRQETTRNYTLKPVETIPC